MASKKSIIIYNDYKDLTISIICALIAVITYFTFILEADVFFKLTAAFILLISAAICFYSSSKANKTMIKSSVSFVLKILLSIVIVFKLIELLGSEQNDNVDDKAKERKRRWKIISAGFFFYFVFDLINEHRWDGNNSS